MTEEQYLYTRIREVMQAYQAAVKPFVDRLVYLKSLEPTSPFLVDLDSLPPDQAEKLKGLTR